MEEYDDGSGVSVLLRPKKCAASAVEKQLSNRNAIGIAYGLLGMLSFSLTLPATRAAVLYFHPSVVAFGRPIVAVVPAGVLLMTRRRPFPARKYWKSFTLVVLGVVIGVPLTFAWGMHSLPAVHGAITLALLPLATALFAMLRAGEHPSKRFWGASLIGSAAVAGFALVRGAGSIRAGDIVLLLSVVASALGYAEGARLARVMPGWEVMSWALVMGAPFLVVPALLAVRAYGISAPVSAWCGFAYVCIISQWLGMFAWYKGLAIGGIARIGQLQLLQPFCTVLFSALLLREVVTIWTMITAAIVVCSVAVSRNAAIEISANQKQ
jgi:drug/metabolite transporter (DMT)-like permease